MLRESHRTRTVFRKVGGFVYVMSVLVSMEGCLAEPAKPPWNTVARQDIIGLLKMVFSTLTVAMRYEPANARFFSTEVRRADVTGTGGYVTVRCETQNNFFVSYLFVTNTLFSATRCATLV